MSDQCENAAILLPATKARPPIYGAPLNEVLRALMIHHPCRLLRYRIDVWIAGAGRIVSLYDSKRLRPERRLTRKEQALFRRRLLAWVSQRQREFLIGVVYDRRDGNLGKAVRALGLHHDPHFFINAIWCEPSRHALADVMPYSFNDPDYCLASMRNLRRLLGFLETMLLPQEQWTSVGLKYKERQTPGIS